MKTLHDRIESRYQAINAPRSRLVRSLLVQDCRSRNYATDTTGIIREAAAFNVAELCPKCSGAVACGETIQVYHPSAHLTAAQIVDAIGGSTRVK